MIEQLVSNFATLGCLSLLNGCNFENTGRTTITGKSTSSSSSNGGGTSAPQKTMNFKLIINKTAGATCDVLFAGVGISRVIPIGTTTTDSLLGFVYLDQVGSNPDSRSGTLTFDVPSSNGIVPGESTMFEYVVIDNLGGSYIQTINKQDDILKLNNSQTETIVINCQSSPQPEPEPESEPSPSGNLLNFEVTINPKNCSRSMSAQFDAMDVTIDVVYPGTPANPTYVGNWFGNLTALAPLPITSTDPLILTGTIDLGQKPPGTTPTNASLSIKYELYTNDDAANVLLSNTDIIRYPPGSDIFNLASKTIKESFNFNCGKITP